MTRGVTIRPADSSDYPAVERLEQASFDDPWPTDAILQELMPSQLRWPILAEFEGAVVGFLMSWRTPDELHILNVAVNPEVRRRGIGSTLIKAAIAEARRCGLGQITLEVRRGNFPACAMYESFGFEQTGLRPRYYADNGEDALIFTLDMDLA